MPTGTAALVGPPPGQFEPETKAGECFSEMEIFRIELSELLVGFKTLVEAVMIHKAGAPAQQTISQLGRDPLRVVCVRVVCRDVLVERPYRVVRGELDETAV